MLNSHLVLDCSGYIEVIDNRNAGVLQIYNPQFNVRGSSALRKSVIREIKSSLKPGQSLELVLHGRNVIHFEHTMKLKGRVILNNVHVPNSIIINSRVSHCKIDKGNVFFKNTNILDLKMTHARDLVVTN